MHRWWWWWARQHWSFTVCIPLQLFSLALELEGITLFFLSCHFRHLHYTQSVRIERPVNQAARGKSAKFTLLATAHAEISKRNLSLNFSLQPFASRQRDQCTENEKHKLGSRHKTNGLSFHFLRCFHTICEPKGAQVRFLLPPSTKWICRDPYIT